MVREIVRTLRRDKKTWWGKDCYVEKSISEGEKYVLSWNEVGKSYEPFERNTPRYPGQNTNSALREFIPLRNSIAVSFVTSVPVGPHAAASEVNESLWVASQDRAFPHIHHQDHQTQSPLHQTREPSSGCSHHWLSAPHQNYPPRYLPLLRPTPRAQRHGLRHTAHRYRDRSRTQRPLNRPQQPPSNPISHNLPSVHRRIPHQRHPRNLRHPPQLP